MYAGGSQPRGRRPRSRPSSGVELVPDARPAEGAVVKLNATECEIVALVAKGLTNRQVAAKLGKAEGAVKHQLSKVYQKLGISRRVRLMMMFRP